MKRSFVLALFFATAVAPDALAGGALVFRFGAFVPAGSPTFWGEGLFDVEDRDFWGFSGGVELGLELLPVLDVTVGVDAYSKGVDTRYRDLVDAERGEIPVNLKLKVVPVVAGVRLFPLGKLRSVLPYVAAGGGLYVVDARLQGSLVDLETLDITSGERSERFWAPGGFLGGGVEVLLSEGVDPGQGWFLGVGFRRSWVRLGPVSESGAARSRFDGWDGSVAVAVRF